VAIFLRRIVISLLRSSWPDVEVELRADAGFAVPAVYEYCEAEGIRYTIALITNSGLEQMAASLLEEAKRRHENHPERKVKLLCEGHYRAGSWDRQRRVLYKAQVMEEGTNTRFVVTNKPEEPDQLYAHYTERGETENRIKDLKVALKADRLSCHRFWANQFRLLVHAAAYWLMDTLRRKLVDVGIERMRLDTLRLRLIKMGGRVRELLTKVRLHLASGHPGQHLWEALTRADVAAS
jgi:Transposase DDE domain group 1